MGPTGSIYQSTKIKSSMDDKYEFSVLHFIVIPALYYYGLCSAEENEGCDGDGEGHAKGVTKQEIAE